MSPDMYYVILTLLCIVWGSWIFFSKRTRIHPPLPPGPLGLPVIGILPFLDPELHCHFAGLAQTYGPLISLWLGNKVVIVASSPSTAKELLKDCDITFANRDIPAAAEVASYGGLDVAWSPYGPLWRMLRKVVVREMLNPTSLDKVYKQGKHEIEKTMKSLRECPGCVVDIGDQMFKTMMNVVMSMLWGETIKGDDKVKMEAGFRVVVSDLTDLLGMPNVSDFFPMLRRFDLQGIVRRTRLCVEKLDGIVESVIDRRKKLDESRGGGCSEEDTKDFLGILLEYKDSGEYKVPFTSVHLKTLLIDMIVGGTDTTSNTLEFAMAEILNNPRVMRRAQDELDMVLRSKDAPLEESHILRLPYLQAIMKETLRLHPTLPLLVPRCPTESSVVSNYTIPKGSRVFVNVWAIHRDPSVWNDPLEFKPERFLGGKPDFGGHDFTYLPFGSGRRICVGVPLAERMVLYALASLLRDFDWKLPQGVERVDIEERFGITLKKRTPLLLIPSQRS